MTLKDKSDILGFELDEPNVREPSFRVDLYPGSRLAYLELLEDDTIKQDEFGLNSEMECQSLKWEFKCPLNWDFLEKTKHDDVRHCRHCEENVYTAYSKKEAESIANTGGCVRIFTINSDLIVIESVGKICALDDISTCLSLIDGILSLEKTIVTFQAKRGYYPAVKIQRLINRLARFSEQIQFGLRDPESGLDTNETLDPKVRDAYKIKVMHVKSLIHDLPLWNKKFEEAKEQLAKAKNEDDA